MGHPDWITKLPDARGMRDIEQVREAFAIAYDYVESDEAFFIVLDAFNCLTYGLDVTAIRRCISASCVNNKLTVWNDNYIRLCRLLVDVYDMRRTVVFRSPGGQRARFDLHQQRVWLDGTEFISRIEGEGAMRTLVEHGWVRCY